MYCILSSSGYVNSQTFATHTGISKICVGAKILKYLNFSLINVAFSHSITQPFYVVCTMRLQSSNLALKNQKSRLGALTWGK